MRVLLVGPSSYRKDIDRLLRARGHEVQALADGGEAFSQLSTDPSIDAVLTGEDAGSISGVELCWQAKALAGRHRQIYVLMMSGSGAEHARVQAMDCGADDVIDLPPRPAEFGAILCKAERLLSLQRSLVRTATIDPLSGVLNRGAFFERSTEICEASHESSLCVALLDIDHLKAVNDLHGHDVGDRAIKAVAVAAQAGQALVGRLGGDEFAALLLGCQLPQALDYVAALENRLSELKLSTPSGSITLACSVGVSEFRSGDSIDSLLKRADVALYRAKREGRNRVATNSIEHLTERAAQTSCVRVLPRFSSEVKERRRGAPPADDLLARICAVIDLLAADGVSAEMAAETIAKKLDSAGVALPRAGACSDYLLAWRAAFREGVASESATLAYRNMVAAIDSIPPEDRVRCVLDSELWDRRRIVIATSPQRQGV